MKSSILDKIIDETRAHLSAVKTRERVAELERLAAAHTPRGFGQHLRFLSGSGPAVIAELKKASPSRGLIRENFSAAELASEMQQAGAAALSVLTEEKHFQGSLNNLRAASERTTIPCLRKDFIVDEFQVVEARAYGADAVLLIVGALPPPALAYLAHEAKNLQLDVLCEVHDEAELERALNAGCEIIGVNNRDLRTFEVDINTSVRLNALIPLPLLRVAESGIHTGADVARLRAIGFDAFLVGESLMKQPSPGEALRKLLSEADMIGRHFEVARQ